MTDTRFFQKWQMPIFYLLLIKTDNSLSPVHKSADIPENIERRWIFWIGGRWKWVRSTLDGDMVCELWQNIYMYTLKDWYIWPVILMYLNNEGGGANQPIDSNPIYEGWIPMGRIYVCLAGSGNNSSS